MMKLKIIPVILCGGSGSRLWPLSRKSFPKQFLKLNDNNSLLQNTYLRISDLDNINKPILVCNEEHRFIVAQQMREIDVKPYSIILEPFGRNTAPAIAISALKSLNLSENIDPILLVLSSDHIIKNKSNFKEAIEYGLKFAKNNRLVHFGIIPDSPQTGYGYIKASKPFVEKKITGENILEFIEKPNLEKAKKLIQDKRFTWNSGIFMFRAKTILEELKKFEEEILINCKESLSKSKIDLDFQRLDREAFKKCSNISIDYSIMEKTNKGTVIPLDAGWSDIGSWESIWENSTKDHVGNHLEGNVISYLAKNCYLKSEKRLLVGIGIKDLIAIETNDAILISDKSQSQKVKDMVKMLKEKGISEGENHSKIYRPWGNYISIAQEERWQVKMIEVNPDGKLSLQMHHHRSEHWIVVNGIANVEVDNKDLIIKENQSCYIPLGSKHRLSNHGNIPLKLIEIQSGTYVGEDDIERFKDNYGRIKA